MRRRRRKTGTWMPVNGHNVVLDADTYHYADLRVDTSEVPPANSLGPSVNYYPIVPDFTLEQGEGALGSNQQLRDIVSGQAWKLRRIVGKLHLACVPQAPEVETENWPNIYVTAGFFVGRARDDAPAQTSLSYAELDPQGKDNAMNPWIWRRSWMLRNILGESGPTSDVSIWYPQDNSEYGSVLDGPHIDSKVSRFINREHRLWFVIAARGYHNGVLETTSTNQPSVAGLLDYRIYGQLARQKNTSSF